MSGSSTGRVFYWVVVLVALGGGLFVWKAHEENKKLNLQVKEKEAIRHQKKLEFDAEALKAETAKEQAKTKAAEARAAEAQQKKSENELKLAEENRVAKETALATEKARIAAAQAETEKAAAQKAAAEAETVKAEAQKAAAEAERVNVEKKAEAEALALQRASAEQKKAEAEQATAIAVQCAAEAAKEKSKNELKAAEANAAAEHDRKLRMYQRASGSRAELMALRRAEKLVALEESGALASEGEMEAVEQTQESTEEAHTSNSPSTNDVVSVSWFDSDADATTTLLETAQERQEAKVQRASRQQARTTIQRLSDLADQAEKDGRPLAAEHHRKSILALVPNYVEVYADLIKERTSVGETDAAQKLVADLFRIMPEWERIDGVVQLLKRDDVFFAGAVAGRVSKSVYVSAFRKYYDLTRRDTDSDGPNGTDPREEKMQHIRNVLARYVPNFEKTYEWCGRYSADNDE